MDLKNVKLNFVEKKVFFALFNFWLKTLNNSSSWLATNTLLPFLKNELKLYLKYFGIFFVAVVVAVVVVVVVVGVVGHM